MRPTRVIWLWPCALGGVLLALSQPPSRLYWVQLLAFAPFLWALHSAISPGGAALRGAVFGLSYAVPLLLRLRLPLVVAAILTFSQTLTWIVFALFAAALSGLPPLGLALALGATATFLVWLETAIVPLWGSAQNFARAWSGAPRAVQFVCCTGIAGAVWAIVTLQALLVGACRAPASAPVLVGAALGIIAVLGALNERLWRQKGPRTLKVATLGWGGLGAASEFDVTDLSRDYARQVESAARQGAQLVVSPEAAFSVADRDAFRAQVKTLAARHQISLAIGYFDQKRNCNCIDFADAQGHIVARYLKTHLVPIYETYFKGNGQRAGASVGGARVGGMICQDDNFCDIARGYGCDGAQIVAVPTNDWDRVAQFHWSNSRWRALECRYALARATSGGISGLVSARGEVLQQCDHLRGGFSMLMAEVPLGRGRPTLYARWGEWFALACGVFALAATLLAA